MSVGFFAFLAACVSDQIPQIPAEVAELAQALDDALVAACPLVALDDEAAHRSCADALTNLPLLRDRMSDPFGWGGQSAPGLLRLEESSRTDFNPRIWRRLYLATFAFPGGHSVQVQGDTAVVRIPVVFRVDLDPGAFPYPFWHSADKWNGYQTAREILFLLRGDRLVGALRSVEREQTRPQREMVWDGRWTWRDGGGLEPRVSLFSYGLSADNPHVSTLESAYRSLEKELRAENCLLCHSPDNAAKMNPLELFSYPNQALCGRRRLVSALSANMMPPDIGIADGSRRAQLIELALRFADIGDAALAHEDEVAAASSTSVPTRPVRRP